MKIRYTKNRNASNFESLEIGDVFYHNGDTFIKIESGLLRQKTGKPIHAINLETGEAIDFFGGDVVEYLDCELVVDN
jgi:hypothetical protein